MAQTFAPILLFVYNRPIHTRRLIESLTQNVPAAYSELIIYSEHWRNEKERPQVEAVRNYVRTVTGFASVRIIEREENYGLAKNVIEAVTETLFRYDRVIVLEDDLLLAPHFLQFMNDALEIYQDEPRVGHVHGCFFVDRPVPALSDSFFIKWAGSWGWATWARAWKYFVPDANELLRQIETNGRTYAFDFDGAYRYTRMLRRQVRGEINSWAIRWYATLFLNDMLALNAGKSLVRNTGFDGSGTHCGDDNLYNRLSLYQETLKINPATPIRENQTGRAALTAYYKETYSFKNKLIRKLKQKLWKTNWQTKKHGKTTG
ncbi:MAG: glycosyltransferase family 2 protein [Prevotellaceae bacterium]|jgi:GR25 family glycosyltransferase involved in LPS biosynthesis|nr:glycosyltransferase family 2 protein [Prevotellaceae bacterium]